MTVDAAWLADLANRVSTADRLILQRGEGALWMTQLKSADRTALAEALVMTRRYDEIAGAFASMREAWARSMGALADVTRERDATLADNARMRELLRRVIECVEEERP